MPGGFNQPLPEQLKQSQAFNTPNIRSRTGYRAAPSPAGGMGGPFGSSMARPGPQLAGMGVRPPAQLAPGRGPTAMPRAPMPGPMGPPPGGQANPAQLAQMQARMRAGQMRPMAGPTGMPPGGQFGRL